MVDIKWWIVRYRTYYKNNQEDDTVMMVHCGENVIRNYIKNSTMLDVLIVYCIGFDKAFEIDPKENTYCCGDNIAEANLLKDIVYGR